MFRKNYTLQKYPITHMYDISVCTCVIVTVACKIYASQKFMLHKNYTLQK